MLRLRANASLLAALAVAAVCVAGGGEARAQQALDEAPTAGDIDQPLSNPDDFTKAPPPRASGSGPTTTEPPAPPPTTMPQAAAAMAANAGQKRQYPNFYELRAAVLDAIGSATTRIWLVTDYLTDGETVSALYIAQYRKIDVKVLLGRGRANHYMSRLNYLKNQNIPVYLKPDNFKIPGGGATALITDNTVLMIDGELDFLSKYKKFNLSYGSPAESQAALGAFSEALNAKLPAVAQKIPLVGRPHTGGSVYIAPKNPSYSGVDTEGAYNYNRNAAKRPEGVPAKLPKATKWQQTKTD